MKTFNQIKEKQYIVRKDNNGQVELATVISIHEIGTDSFIFSVEGVISKQRTEFKAYGSVTEVTVMTNMITQRSMLTLNVLQSGKIIWKTIRYTV